MHTIRELIPAVGVNFAILIAWTAISCITLPLVQWFVRRGDVRAAQPSVVNEAPIRVDAGSNSGTLTSGESLRRVSTERNPVDSDLKDEDIKSQIYNVNGSKDV